MKVSVAWKVEKMEKKMVVTSENDLVAQLVMIKVAWTAVLLGNQMDEK